VTIATGFGIYHVDTPAGPLQIVALPWVLRSKLLTRDEYKNLSLLELNNLMLEKVSLILETEIAKLDPAVPAILAAADIHCQPNVAPEPFGLAFVEPLLAGLPVVTSDFGGPREIVTPACGILVAPDDMTALRSALQELIASPRRRAELGAAGPARARELCDPARQIARLEGVLSTAGPRVAA